MSARLREGVHTGHPDALVQPVDTLGFKTPGPNLWREFETGTGKSLGLALKLDKGGTDGPGIIIIRAASTIVLKLFC